MKTRIEKDSLGEMNIPMDKLWGAVTQRSLNNFDIGEHPMPVSVIKALAQIKKAAATVNSTHQRISSSKADYIKQACEMVIQGQLNQHFPLSIWQTGSGTHSNMNANEVIANQAHLLSGGDITDKPKNFHPNDDINKSQSSNDVFPSAIHMAVAETINHKTIPALETIEQALLNKSKEFHNIIKTGRTHMMDAVPVRLGDEFSAFAQQISWGIKSIKNSLPHLLQLPIGGTAVGTGLNTPPNYSIDMCREISQLTGLKYSPADNRFESMTSKSALLEVQHALSQIATDLFKIVNDLRMMASGPRTGFQEIELPANEPGSSIMPGKVNPTQIESAQMVCAKVIANTNSTAISNMSGHFQLNTFMPLIAYNTIESASLLAQTAISLSTHCINGIKPNNTTINHMLSQSLMLVTALNSAIGYEKAAKIAQHAHKNNISLKQAALESGLITEKEFDTVVDPAKMV